MNVSRRNFLAMAGTSVLAWPGRPATAAEPRRPSLEELDRAAAEPVLKLDSLSTPVKIASMELLRNGREFLVRVRSTDGAEGLAVANGDRLRVTYPIFLTHIVPYLIGKDARDWEAHLFGLYRHQSNYKLQGLALWVCVAAAELAILDMLGKLAGKSIGELLGGVRRRDIAVYRASGNRGNMPEAEIEYLQKLADETGA
jgi:L-alanine-DL-glutamate epimerase-like enolase superfamily enzyme